MESEATFKETFNASQPGHGEVTLTILGKIDILAYQSAVIALENIRERVKSIAMNKNQEITDDVKPRGGALDPSEITAKIPGVNPIDRRLGPRKVKKS